MTKVIICKTWKDTEKISLVPGVRMTRINREVYRSFFRFGTEKYVHHLSSVPRSATSMSGESENAGKRGPGGKEK